ncbi:hypothetical protein BS47DRAFT_1349514 [Hydnum rufescens UP504]|uniref:G domain-containing protein n=1 Tax=Hydnum rufescens UP504 TaxID=1448309 RepID=A0A9P6AP90_9AGAM|nr:hypothetical protein BS47DRAFT_1349514 [Hydnum rufescens UP504]
MLKSIRKHFKLSKKFTLKEVPDEDVPDEDVPDEDVPHKEVPGKGVPDEEVPDEELSNKDRARNNRFRILILGPANAGKTTLLERLTDSPAGAAIVTRNGKRSCWFNASLSLSDQGSPRGYDQRGIHNIEDEITYASNSDFVFHDSGGFEAGGVEELQAVWKFIQKHSLASPSQHLHAIWLCIPTDNDRPFGFLQSGFFSKSTASGMFLSCTIRSYFTHWPMSPFSACYWDLHEIGWKRDESEGCVKQKVAEFVHGLETEFQKERYPPAGFARVGSMYILSEE